MNTEGIRADDGGQLFLLAGLVLAMSLITLSIVASQNVHSPARQIEAEAPVALDTYNDYKTAVREAVRFHLDSFGLTEGAFKDAIGQLTDQRRLGLSGRDVNAFVRLNGTKETRLCGGTPAYGNASLDGIAQAEVHNANSQCTNQKNSDGIIKDRSEHVIAAALEIGVVEPRYTVEETIVVTSIRDQFYVRDATNVTVGATVDDSFGATDASDGVTHEVRAAKSNVLDVTGFAAIPHAVHSEENTLVSGERDVNWTVAVANPTDKLLHVDRVEISETTDQVPWETSGAIVDQHWPTSGWTTDESSETTTNEIDNSRFDSDLADWDDTNRSVADADEYEVTNDSPGCQDVGPSNRCLKLKTNVSGGEGAASPHYYLNQSFQVPSYDSAEITFKYFLKADLTVDDNTVNVSIVDSNDDLAYTFETVGMNTAVWTPETGDLTGDLNVNETYTLSVHTTQDLCDPDDVSCLVTDEHEATAWVDGFFVNFTDVASQKLVWDDVGVGTADDAVVPARSARNFSALVRTAEWTTLSGGSADMEFSSRVRASTDGGSSYTWYTLQDPSPTGFDQAYDSKRGPSEPSVSIGLNDTTQSVTEAGLINPGFGDGSTGWDKETDLDPARSTSKITGNATCEQRGTGHRCAGLHTTVPSSASTTEADHWLNQSVGAPGHSSADLDVLYKTWSNATGETNWVNVSILDDQGDLVDHWNSTGNNPGVALGDGWLKANLTVSGMQAGSTYDVSLHAHQEVPVPGSGAVDAVSLVDAVHLNFTRSYVATMTRTFLSATPEEVTVVVEESSGVAGVPGHDLRILVPADFELTDWSSSTCGALSQDCYPSASSKEISGGTIWTFTSATGGFDAGRRANLTLDLKPPGVGTRTVYRMPMEMDPATGSVPNATADANLVVTPTTIRSHTLSMIYYSEDTTQTVSASSIVGVELGLDLSSNQAMDVTVQVWNWTSADGWGWSDLRDGSVDFTGVSWRIHRRNTTEPKALGIMDATGAQEIPPPPDGTAPPEGTVAIRLVHSTSTNYRLRVDLAYFRIEHV